jgi:site-specific recombinase XerD
VTHPDFALLTTSWDLALRADGYSDSTVRSYRQAVAGLAAWLDETGRGDVAPADLGRDHVRGWLVHRRETRSSSTARAEFAGVRHFCRFLVAEGEATRDATDGIRTPPAGDPATPVLSVDDLRALLAACSGSDFTARRDTAVILLFADAGLRRAELAGLAVADVDLRDRLVYVVGKGSRRSGPRRRAVPIGVKTARALDRYLRERRRHPYAGTAALWLGARGRPAITDDSIEAMLGRRAEQAGLKGLHPHVFRHTFAHAFRAAGGNEGDLMLLGGWRSRAMLDRYGKSAAGDRATEAARRLSLGDRL